MDSEVTRRQPLLSLFAVAVTGALLALTERAAYAVPPTLDVSPKPPICVTRPGTVLASVNYNLNGADKAIPTVRKNTARAKPKT